MIFSSIHSRASEQPSRPAVIYNGKVISYSQFAGAIAAAINHLEAQNISRGGVVAVKITHLFDCWVAAVALQSLGYDTVCVGSMEVLVELELADVAGIVITERESDNTAHYGALVETVVTLPVPEPGGRDAFDSRGADIETSGGNHILYTSGTTGRHKKIVYHADYQETRDNERIRTLALDESTFFHCFNFGLWTAVGYAVPPSVWRIGGCVILDQRQDWPHHFLQSEVTRAIMLPEQLHRLLDSIADRPLDSPLMDFRLYASGGFISRKLAEQILQRLTTNLFVSYGSTEVVIAALESMPVDMDDLHWLERTHHRQLEIIDEEGNPCPVDTEGQVRIRLEPQDCSSYLDDPASSHAVFRDGYFYPGDMAVARTDGRVRILGRSADVINLGGQKLSVAPMEENIQSLLGIKTACLLSGINRAGEDELVIVLESSHWPEKSKLDHLVNEFKQFDQVRFEKIHPFPRTKTGTSKIDRVALRKQVFLSQG